MNTIELIEPEFKPTRFTDKDTGAIFKWGFTSEPYILARIDSGIYSLISLSDGNRFANEADLREINNIIIREGFQLIASRSKITIKAL